MIFEFILIVDLNVHTLKLFLKNELNLLIFTFFFKIKIEIVIYNNNVNF